ncbi:SgcJ/EcaC family oxidoreductase [Streptomyces sp. NPDC089919]|uniref:YybH family protein n=1 Tax=Streptomyces sp. NPDC089919 TaxID=3155188 RepID=UPI00342687B2
MTGDRAADEEQIWNQILAIAAGFKANDAAVFSDVYAHDADWTNAFGTTRHGREEIVSYLRRLFADPRFAAGRPVGPPQAKLRWVTDDVAVVTTYIEREGQQTTSGEVLPTRRNHSIKVLQRQGDRWLVVSDLYMDARDEQTLAPGDAPEPGR